MIQCVLIKCLKTGVGDLKFKFLVCKVYLVFTILDKFKYKLKKYHLILIIKFSSIHKLVKLLNPYVSLQSGQCKLGN